jgi:His/Glu/Gln/Arg/opine family amino acid ABC transporter permease subunit
LIEFFARHWSEVLPGLRVTVAATAATVPLFLTAGFILAIARTMGPAPVRWLVVGFVEAVRGTPLLIQLFWVFYALPFFGITLNPLPAGIATLTINFGAYASEIFRAGIQSVPVAQLEAATVLGMKRRTIVRRVILPQALVISVPPLSNQIIEVFKATSLFSIIAAGELVLYARGVLLRTLNPTSLWVMVAFIYFIIAFPASILLSRLERRLTRSMRL